MRVLELVLLALLVLASARLVVPRWRQAGGVAGLLAAALAVTTVLHALVEGARWQLVPAYALVVAFVLAALRSREHPPRGGRAALAGGIVAVVLTLVAGALAWALPVTSLGPLPGEHDVATTSFRLVDPTRDERYTDDPSDAREVVVQAWYPTRDTGPRAPFVEQPRAFGAATARFLDMPSFVLDHLGLVRTRSVQDGDLAALGRSYPVIVYSHGWGGFRRVQVGLMEDLASHGFVVLALDHTYGAVATVFPDGPVVPLEPDALPSDAPPAEYDAAAATLEQVYAEDVLLLLDHLAAEGNATRFAGLLDLSRIGLLGHSTGGGAVVTACATDDRCDAVAGLDPWVEPVPDDVLAEGLSVPLLSIRSEEWVGDDNDRLLARLHAASTGGTTRLAIAGTSHRDVTMLPLLSPLASSLGLAGETDASRTHRIVSDYLVAFFDRTLRDGTGGLVDADPSPFDEVSRSEP